MPGNLKRYQIATAKSMASSGTSNIVNIAWLDNIGIQVNIISGSPTGTFTVQVSVDHDEDQNGNVLKSGNWVNLNLSANVAAGSPANLYFDINQISSPFIRLAYTESSGSGTFDAFLTAKSV